MQTEDGSSTQSNIRHVEALRALAWTAYFCNAMFAATVGTFRCQGQVREGTCCLHALTLQPSHGDFTEIFLRYMDSRPVLRRQKDTCLGNIKSSRQFPVYVVSRKCEQLQLQIMFWKLAKLCRGWRWMHALFSPRANQLKPCLAMMNRFNYLTDQSRHLRGRHA